MGTRFDWLDELKLHRWEFLAHEPDVWVACETHTSKVLEDAWHADQTHQVVTLAIGSYKYQVSMDDLTQRNLLTGKVRRLRRSHAMDPAKLQQAMGFCAAYTAMEKELCKERRAHEKLQKLVDHLQASPSGMQSQDCQEKQILKLQIENRERFFENQLHAERCEKEALKLQVREMQEQAEKHTRLIEALRREQLHGSNRARCYEIQLGVHVREKEALPEALRREQVARLRSSKRNDALNILLGFKVREKNILLEALRREQLKGSNRERFYEIQLSVQAQEKEAFIEALRWEQLQGINRARLYEIQLGVHVREKEALLEALRREQVARLRSSKRNDALNILLGFKVREKNILLEALRREQLKGSNRERFYEIQLSVQAQEKEAFIEALRWAAPRYQSRKVL